MPYYKVYYQYVSGSKLRKGHVRLDAKNKEDAKLRAIRGEKPRLIAVNKVVRA